MLHSQLLKMARYNMWANQLLMDFILHAGEAKADQKLDSSFDSIRKTLYHIYDAEAVWLIRLNNQQLDYWPPSRDFNLSLKEFAEIFVSKSKELFHWIDGGDENTLLLLRDYHNVAGNAYTSLVADMIQHCFNHSTYHRGQLITMLRSVGYTQVSSTDYILWSRTAQV